MHSYAEPFLGFQTLPLVEEELLTKRKERELSVAVRVMSSDTNEQQGLMH